MRMARRIFPALRIGGPIERMITHEKLAFMTDNGAMTIDYCNKNEEDSFSVARLIPSYAVNLTRLMEQAEAREAQLITGIRVDNVVQRDSKSRGCGSRWHYSGSQSRNSLMG